MKKTIITLLALAGVAGAATTTVTDLTVDQDFTDNSVTYTAPTDNNSTGSFGGSGIWASGGGNRAHSALTFVLNLSKIYYDYKTNGDAITLVKVDTGTDVGLLWSNYNGQEGITGYWGGNANNAIPYQWDNGGGALVTAATLGKDSWSVANNTTDVFITLTMTVANTDGAQGGEQLYAAGSDTSYFSNSKGLGSSNNTSITAIEFNTDYIVAASVTSGWVPGTTATSLGTSLQDTFLQANGGKVDAVKLIPEPATATLSLLALCGLAARRRRK